MVQTVQKSPSPNKDLKVIVPEVDHNAPLKIEQAEETKENPSGKINKKLLITGVSLASLILLATVGVLILRLNQPSKEEENIPAVSVEEVKEEDKILDKSSWTIEVLNGSGTAGMAALAAEKIKTLGYTVSKIDNADKQNYKLTEVYLNKKLLSQGEFFLSDISGQISGATISGELIDSTSSARIILGQNFK